MAKIQRWKSISKHKDGKELDSDNGSTTPQTPTVKTHHN